uniref:Transcription factor A, mitochondrial n=1 Tax=Esox lucius TaxID=8010 RepID=A0A3P8YQE6_ESOLU
MAPFGLMSAGASFLAKSFGLFSNVSSLARCVSVLPAVKTFSSTAGAPPKRPLNGYMRFLKQQQPLIVKQYPDVSAVDVVRKIAQQWRALSPEQKQPFEQESVVARAQFKVDLQTFKAQLTPAQTAALKEERRQRLAKRKAIRRKRELNNLGKPKRPRSPFNIYMAEHFEESKGTTTTGKLKMLREDWYKLAASEKQVFIHLSQDDKVRYKNEIQSWEEHMVEMGREDLIRRKETRKKTAPTKKAPVKGRKKSTVVRSGKA